MTPEGIFFYIFAIGTILGSLGVITSKQPINSALSLVLSFFFLAGIYILLNAQFMAVIQILVYAGAIMVLFMFVLMLLNLRDDELGKPRLNNTKLLGGLFAAVLCYVFATASISFVGASEQLWTTTVASEFGMVAPIGRELMTKWILPFELVAVLLLVGIVGAVVVAKRRL